MEKFIKHYLHFSHSFNLADFQQLSIKYIIMEVLCFLMMKYDKNFSHVILARLLCERLAITIIHVMNFKINFLNAKIIKIIQFEHERSLQ